jgi:hypothetical protein
MSSIMDRLTAAQNSHDADLFASYFAEDYRSAQPAHPGRSFRGRAQVLANWTSVFAGVPDFRAELLAQGRVPGDVEWGELDWRGHHVDGSEFAMCGVIILTIRDDQIVEGRLYIEPVDHDGDSIAAAVEELYQAPDP